MLYVATDDEIVGAIIECLSDDGAIIECLSDDDDEDINSRGDFSQQKDDKNASSFNKVNFLLIFRVVYNIPDQAIVLLLKIFRHSIVKIYDDSSAINSNANIPLSIWGCYSLLGLKEAPFRQYTVCPSCHLLYDSDRLLSSNTRAEELKCTFVEFPNHPQARFRLSNFM